jgi:hypothetical protein
MTDVSAIVRNSFFNLSAVFLSEQLDMGIISGLRFWFSVKYSRLWCFRQHCIKLSVFRRLIFISGVNKF